MTRDGLSRSGMIVIALAALSSSALNEFASGPARAAARHRHPRPELLLPEAPAGANSFALTHDGKILAMVDGDTLSLWDTRSWVRQRSIYITSPPPLPDPALTEKKVERIHLAFVPDDTMLVLSITQSGLKTAERQNPYQQFYRYDLQRWTMPSLQPLPPIRDGTLSADGQQALIRIKDDKFCRLDLRTGARLTTVPVELEPPDLYVSPDGALAAPAGEAVTLDVRSLRTGKTVRTLKDTRAETWLANPILPPVEFSPDRRFAATAGEDPNFQLPISEHAPTDAAWLHQLNLEIWDLHTGKLLHALPGRSNQDATEVLRFSSDSRRLVSMGAGMSRWLDVWSTLTGKQLLDAFSFGESHENECYFFGESLMLTPQAELVAGRITLDDIDPKSWEHWLHHESHLGLWDLRTGKLQSISPQAPRAIAGLRFSPDGRWVAAGDSGEHQQVKPVRLWNRSTGKLVRVWQLPEPLKTLDFSPDSRLLRVGELDEVGWWKIATGKLDHIVAELHPACAVKTLCLQVDGAYWNDTLLLRCLKLGDCEVQDVLLQSGASSRPPVIGLDVLSRFLVTMDFRNNQLILQPRRAYLESVRIPGWTGIWFRQDKRKWCVTEVEIGSPAQEADVHARDQLLRVDGYSCDKLSGFAVDSVLSGYAGTRAHLILKREGATIHTYFDRLSIFARGDPHYGLAVRFADRKLHITSVLHDSDAEKAGLHTGDFIVSLNGHPVNTMSLSDVSRFLYRPYVDLLIKPEGENLIKEVELQGTAERPVR